MASASATVVAPGRKTASCAIRPSKACTKSTTSRRFIGSTSRITRKNNDTIVVARDSPNPVAARSGSVQRTKKPCAATKNGPLLFHSGPEEGALHAAPVLARQFVNCEERIGSSLQGSDLFSNLSDESLPDLWDQGPVPNTPFGCANGRIGRYPDKTIQRKNRTCILKPGNSERAGHVRQRTEYEAQSCAAPLPRIGDCSDC